jgi:hypothetical protein
MLCLRTRTHSVLCLGAHIRLEREHPPCRDCSATRFGPSNGGHVTCS